MVASADTCTVDSEAQSIQNAPVTLKELGWLEDGQEPSFMKQIPLSMPIY